jgi:BirA family transcriptional regulator, biotin operon repressor / biotin---[acetyl-CoA-carboxylase] ligase
MNAKVIRWPAEAIWEQIAPILPNFTVEVLPVIDSTNTELMRRAKAGQTDPILLIAERQTAGRGRLGRHWHDLSNSTGDIPTLTFSMGLPLAPLAWSGLSLAVGLSIATSLHANIGLKWPNDLWLCQGNSDRKLAGILIETCAIEKQRYVVIGVGINIVAPSSDLGATQATLRTPAAWLQELLPAVTAADALQTVMLPLVQAILQFSQHGFAPYQNRFNALDVLKSRKVCVRGNAHPERLEGLEKLEGQGKGVNILGEYLIQTAQGEMTINSSEVSVKPL